jgi:predicted glycoside hydrolase/deacetylase ChbG (UPF0249 family)
MNPILEKMGYGIHDRVVVVHADDLGMCQATLTAFDRLIEHGIVTSGSAMVPCSWFPALAEYCRKTPQADVGVHVTMTCEWDAYRWGPVSNRDPESGLMDEEGYFPRSAQHVWEQADEEALLEEITIQIDRAMAAGIDVTHVDDHMGGISHPRFFKQYIGLALSRGLPPREMSAAHWKDDTDDWQRDHYHVLGDAQRLGAVLFDYAGGLPLDQPHHQDVLARKIFDEIPEGGLSLLVAHPAVDTPELRAIAPDWPCRVANYETLMCPDLRQELKAAGIHLIGFRPLRDAMRKK